MRNYTFLVLLLFIFTGKVVSQTYTIGQYVTGQNNLTDLRGQSFIPAVQGTGTGSTGIGDTIFLESFSVINASSLAPDPDTLYIYSSIPDSTFKLDNGTGGTLIGKSISSHSEDFSFTDYYFPSIPMNKNLKYYALFKEDVNLEASAGSSYSGGSTISNYHDTLEWNSFLDLKFKAEFSIPASHKTDIIKFSVDYQVGESVINNTNHTVYASMGKCVPLNSVPTRIWVSSGATITRDMTNVDFSNGPVEFTVTAEDGVTKQVWTITVEHAETPPIPTDGLVAYWPFMFNANDESGNGHNGTMQDVTTTSNRFNNSGAAFRFFSASNSYVMVDTAGLLLNNYTYSMWVKIVSAPSASNYYGLLSVGGMGADQGILYGNGNSAGHGFTGYTRSSNGISSAIDSVLRTNVWTHIATTRSDSILKIYINGILSDSIEVDRVPSYNTTDCRFYIGCRYDNTSNADASIDDIRVYNKPLSPDDILALYTEVSDVNTEANIVHFSIEGQVDTTVIDNDSHTVLAYLSKDLPLDEVNVEIEVSEGATYSPPGTVFDFSQGPVIINVAAEEWLNSQDWKITVTYKDPIPQADGLVAYWPFNGNANDSTGNGFDGEVHNAYLTEDRFGNENKAYRFYSDFNSMISASAVGLDLPNYTYSLWVKANSLPASESHYGFLSIGSTNGDQGFLLCNNYYGQNGYEALSYFDNGNSTITDNIKTINTWIFLTMTRSDTTLKFYTNGILFDSISTTEPPYYGLFSPVLRIGCRYSNTYFADAYIDEIKIYNRDLSSDEILKEYNDSKTNPVNYSSYDVQSGISIYPNPSSGVINIKLDHNDIAAGCTVKIYNSLGVLVFEKAMDIEINTLNLKVISEKGFYIVNICDLSGKVLKNNKLIIE